MSVTRLLLVLAVLGAGYWLLTKSGLVGERRDAAPASQSPVERAREGARSSAARNAQTDAANRSLDGQATAGAVSENMTREQVRALLGPPNAVDFGMAESGASREKWTYRTAGKTVIFENGIVVRID